MDLRLSLRQQLQQAAEIPVAERSAQYQEADYAAQEQSLRGFRPHGTHSQTSQDHTRDVYFEFLKVLRYPHLSDAADATVEEAAFPADHDLMFTNIRQFILWYIDNAKPGSIKSEHISYNAAVHLRINLLFWIQRSYKLRRIEAPPAATITAELNEPITARLQEGRLTNEAAPKTYMGLPEISHLVEFDSSKTRCIELAEVHHLAWCIGRFTAVRPGSLGPSQEQVKNPYSDDALRACLQWRDIRVSRIVDRPGQFTATITIRNLKGNGRVVGKRAATPHRSLTFILLSPQRTENLLFSVPHRLLTIALRRNLIVGVETVADLFADDRFNVTFKAEALSQPVLCASNKRQGTGVDLASPLAAPAITRYLTLAGRRAGFTEDVTFYSIRRRVATELSRIIGVDATRQILDHEPGTKTLERHYMGFAYGRDLVGTGLGEDVQQSREQLQMESNALLTHRLTPAQVAQAQIYANDAFDRIVADNEERLEIVDPREAHKYIERLRYRLKQEAIFRMAKEADQNITLGDMRTRQEDIRSGQAERFTQRLIEQEIAAAEPAAEADADDLYVDNDGTPITQSVEESNDGVEIAVPDYQNSARIFMELMLKKDDAPQHTTTSRRCEQIATSFRGRLVTRTKAYSVHQRSSLTYDMPDDVDSLQDRATLTSERPGYTQG